jgi:hypothetical protein
MSLVSSINSFKPASKSAWKIVKTGLRALKSDPAIVLYPLTLFLAIMSTVTVTNAWIYMAATTLAHESIFEPAQGISVYFFSVLAILISTIYGYMLLSYFTCTIAAAVIGHLEGDATPLFYGVKLVAGHFRRISHFAALSLILIPLGIMAQRHRLDKPKPAAEVIGSSLTLTVGGIAPAILSSTKGVEETIMTSIQTMGKAWHENLIIKLGIYLTLLLIGVLISINSDGLVVLLLSLALFTVAKVLTAVFTATIYWQNATNNGRHKLIKQ